MESAYDRKFKEMKEYIPFLDMMITKLESASSSSSSNPRQAQLDKIRSLRDLLLDKKKRMKMENLLKCEQVLVNLYAKVERDTLPGIRKASEPLFPSNASTETQNTDLNTARNKLKNAAPKCELPDEDPNTLPEIAPASETEVVCTPGSKEPALFQRRPHRNSRSPQRKSPARGSTEKKSPQKNVPKRNYTRVLVSPEPSPRRWTPSEDSAAEKPLFSRRSPRKSPKTKSPQKKDRKMSSKSGKPNSKDLDITVEVPQDSIDSLNTSDILSRIINCPDNDVDIDTLRDVRSQILGELKKSGTNDDISDLILKSYKKKKRFNKRNTEVEEGELSDSESEAINSVYGSLVVEKDNLAQSTKTSENKEKLARKIKFVIRKVINSDQDETTDNKKEVTEEIDLEMFDIENKNAKDNLADISQREYVKAKKGTIQSQLTEKMKISSSKNKPETFLTINVEEDEDDLINIDVTKDNKDSDSSYIDISSSDTESQTQKSKKTDSGSVAPFKPNFYNEHKEVETAKSVISSIEIDSPDKEKNKDMPNILTQEKIQSSCICALSETAEQSETPSKKSDITVSSNQTNLLNKWKEAKSADNETLKEVEKIPLLNTEPSESKPAKKDVVSEIDILQALKNEILSESITTIPGSDSATPLLHQPKLTKVASAQEIIAKKRISIEKYKEKSVNPKTQPLFLKDPNSTQNSEHLKKTSIKLTEQEQQRFLGRNCLPLPLDSSDEDETVPNYTVDDVYGDLAPKSPENDDKITTDDSTPVIIPEDPVKPTTATSKADIDMRTLTPILSPNAPKPVPFPTGAFPHSTIRNEKPIEPRRPPLLDPRVRRDFQQPIGKESPIAYGTPRHASNLSTPNRNPNMTPNSRSFETTPSRQSFDTDDSSSRKHVYAPFPTFEPRDQREQQLFNRDAPGPRWEPNVDSVLENRHTWDIRKDTDLRDTGRPRAWDERDQRGRSSRDYKSRNDADNYHDKRDEYLYSRMDCPRTPVHPFGRSDCPTTPTPSFGRSDCQTTPIHPFGRTDCPTTPCHPFGRSECPTTPVHPFGRSECPTTPVHPFGRSDCPTTPVHPFGRSDMPVTPNHPFGRSDSYRRTEAPMTPSHPFGRSDAPMTPSHPFGRPDAPMTPSHPFGRSDAPMTPNHSFGRSEAPMTPSHTFGRSDLSAAPMTPSHPFGMSDYQQTSGPKVINDPRLNRPEHPSKSGKFEENRDRGFYKDRNNSGLSNKSYNSESYRNHSDQSVGRNDKNKFNRERVSGRETSVGRSFTREYENERLYTRDRSIGRSNVNSTENEKMARNYKEQPRRDFQRGHSVGRSGTHDDRLQRSSSRGPSDNRNYTKQRNENTLSVEPQTGKSFTIDTSVNSTFLEFLNGKGLQVFDYSFDSRRQRAASVGRSLTNKATGSGSFRESSVGRTLSKPAYSAAEQDTSGYKRMVNFVRARSMGREMTDKTNKSFTEIKADLKSFRPNYTHKPEDKITQQSKHSNYRDPRSRKGQCEKRNEIKNIAQNKKPVYSPRKNYRDPRMHRDSHFDNKSKNRKDDKRNYGIVYSSDNIAKGTILGSGYGVKNYKIPKIKKPVVEKEPVQENRIDLKDGKTNRKENISEKQKLTKSESNQKSSDVKAVKANKEKSDSKIIKKNEKPEPKSEKKSKIDNKLPIKTSQKGTTKPQNNQTTPRSALVESEEETIPKTRKAKKIVINSDSEPDNNEKETNEVEVKDSSKITVTETKENSAPNSKDDLFNSSFVIDDFDIFPENLTANPVLDNINALIAELNNDIDASKEENLSCDMFDNIDSPEGNVEETLKDISQVIENDEVTMQDQEDSIIKEIKLNSKKHANENSCKEMRNLAEHSGNVKCCESDVAVKDAHHIDSVHKQSAINSIAVTVAVRNAVSDNNSIPATTDDSNAAPVDNSNAAPVDNNNASVPCDNSNAVTSEGSHASPEDIIQDNTVHNSNDQKKKGNGHEDVVSTTDSDQMSLKKHDESNEDRPSTPDSTLETSSSVVNKSRAEDLPDSTNEKKEMHSDVSSTRDQSETDLKDVDISVQKENPVSSIENVLSILQDKSKIKELLSMLGGAQTGENEKIKKTLEKLSQVVSDDEDTINESIEKCEDGTSKVTDVSKDETNTQVSIETHIDNSNLQPIDKPLDPEKNKSVSSEIQETEKTETNEKITKAKKPKKPLKRGKKAKPKNKKNALPGKRVTRSGTSNQINKPKKPSRELRQLQESIKEMFIKDDILNATGLRMCRLSKLVDEKTTNQEEENTTQSADPKPVVVLEKFKDSINTDEKKDLKIKKKPKPKQKTKLINNGADDSLSKPKDIKTSPAAKHKPGPKSKTKNLRDDSDPYSFDDSNSEATTTQTSEHENESETEDDSLASLKSSESSEILAELKKKRKRKKGRWQSGIFKKRRKKNETKQEEQLINGNPVIPNKEIKIPDMNCFTDKSYCFLKNVMEYPCRLCNFNGPEIVKHYKTDHPHTEIPLSRMNVVVAREAVEQCEDINFQAISKMHTEKYICRFCFEEFGKKHNVLEEFFWHVVSMHTGEYKRLCSECVNVTRCPFNLDIPPPPKDLKGQLIGYICGKCNFTQISLENLKTHVIVRHNDEQTAVYTINLAMMSKKTIQSLMKRCNAQDKARVLRSLRSRTENPEQDDRNEESDSMSDVEDLKTRKVRKKHSSTIPLHSKLSFESDDNMSEAASGEVKIKTEDIENDNKSDSSHIETPDLDKPDSNLEQDQPSSDIFDCSHFKISYATNGSKEYVCCINGNDNHYKTHLLISMKKHVQLKHLEIWDGYCSICKVIVMPQGGHRFKECLQHMLEKHMDNFPVLQQIETEVNIPTQNSPEEIQPTIEQTTDKTASLQTYINLRPLADLIAPTNNEADKVLPKIHNVVSLGSTTPETQEKNLTSSPKEIEPIFKCPTSVEKTTPKPEKPYKYEKMQAEVMSKKHLAVFEAMLSEDKLVQIFKCAGRFCSFTTDSADAALLHASTHQRLGGENSLLCSYCDYDCQGCAMDLVMHVFKKHGHCRFVCGLCFYRAVASQLVLAHIHRVHGGTQGVVLETATVAPVDRDVVEMLPREVAVQHYYCPEFEKTCKFKTYIQGNFIEHIPRHAAPYKCNACCQEFGHPMELIQHLKTHGLKLYQCVWCVEGGDNEGDFLAHSSSRHPSRLPQAYVRIIKHNQKGDGSKPMILPLAKFNAPVVTRLVTPQNTSNNPTKEAEKALDMEKLIAAMPTSQDRTKTNPTRRPSQRYTNEQEAEIATLVATESARLVTPPPSTLAQDQSELLPLTPIKTEPIDESPAKNPTAVICLDSDEEDNIDSLQTEPDKQNVIDLSDDDRSLTSGKEKYKKFGPLQLYKCNCQMVFKSLAGFKRHVYSCFAGKNIFLCGHCTFSTSDVDEFYKHYNIGHAPDGEQKSTYSCGLCNRVDIYLQALKYHMKKDHGFTNFSVTSKPDGNYVVTGSAMKSKPGPKRKLSGGAAAESSPKRVRYGAQDLHKLPQKPILDELAFCADCEFSTKVRLNLVRHIQQHADNQLVPQTAPVNPVPHLETNEKHFDKMINLASSSLEIARVEKSTPSVTLHMPPEVAAKYPKYVPDRQRHTCGAKGCSYISVDEAMLKCHWETLHAGSNDFHCVHCPPYQSLDTSKPLTASRIIAHLKMHDIRLYACSACTYYHYLTKVLEKHLTDVHKGAAQIMIVREESTGSSSPAGLPQATTAPTMDLKAWKCGLCAFKSMLRPEVIDHCSKIHSSKMQFKCPVCPFRTSTLENVTKHKAKSHPGNNEDVFYYYYREGSIPDEKDGTPRWMKQRQKMGTPDTEVKTEDPESVQQSVLTSLLKPILPAPAGYNINLNIVKEEVVDPVMEESMEALCKKYGEICDPNGLKFKCPLCKVVTEDNKDTMQSHLYEELQYRKWACSICCYKAFHKTGLKDHMVTEHRQSRAIEPIELDADTRIERWVNKVLDHQAAIIETNKSKLAQQKIHTEKPTPTPVNTAHNPPEPVSRSFGEKETENLIQAFGLFGGPHNGSFCCPKCSYLTTDESAMKDHLEIELNKIRWRCSSCSENSQNYHEAQLHSKTCKSSRPGQASRPVEAIRDPVVRAAWLAAVVRTQKQDMKQAPKPEPESPIDDMITGPLENSLLVVRYEERVPTPEVEMIGRHRVPTPDAETIGKKKRPAPTSTAPSPDSDDERLVIDEITDDADASKKQDTACTKKCIYCPYVTSYKQQLENHILRHYNMRPMMCCHCEETTYYKGMEGHNAKNHPHLPKKFKKTPVPSGPPPLLEVPTNQNKDRKRSSSSSEELPKRDSKTPTKDEPKRDEGTKLICLVCERACSESEQASHTHDKPTYFAKKGEVVIKCCVCLSLFPNINVMQEHNKQCHPNTAINYAYFKINHNNREILQCGHCSKRFTFFRDLKSHHNVVHSALQLKYETRPYYPGAYDFECETESKGESSKTIENASQQYVPDRAAKRVARKSTTKLPNKTVARKSTSKLPCFVYSEESESDREEREYSYYGSKPTPLAEFKNVTTRIPKSKTVIPLERFKNICMINPVVLVEDYKK
ncbi:hypothetical protein O0L34_g11892 [Tuta absoluta]|nr:hypothetical protein O0L34_g11892 [Tuta absoluta]